MRDKGEILDYVERNGPISYKRICGETPMYSPDEIYDALSELRDEGKLETIEGDIHEQGTTRTLWRVNE